jgi:hypothetical protein
VNVRGLLPEDVWDHRIYVPALALSLYCGITIKNCEYCNATPTTARWQISCLRVHQPHRSSPAYPSTVFGTTNLLNTHNYSWHSMRHSNRHTSCSHIPSSTPCTVHTMHCNRPSCSTTYSIAPTLAVATRKRRRRSGPVLAHLIPSGPWVCIGPMFENLVYRDTFCRSKGSLRSFCSWGIFSRAMPNSR